MSWYRALMRGSAVDPRFTCEACGGVLELGYDIKHGDVATCMECGRCDQGCCPQEDEDES